MWLRSDDFYSSDSALLIAEMLQSPILLFRTDPLWPHVEIARLPSSPQELFPRFSSVNDLLARKI